MKIVFKQLAIGSVFLLGVIGCNQQPELEMIQNKISDRQRLICRMDSLHFETSTLWDSVNALMDHQLPVSIPAEERTHLLAVRNAPLIEMFEVYDLLDDPTKKIIREAGIEDSLLAQRTRETMDSVEKMDFWLDSILVSVSSKWPALLPDIRNQMNEPCPRSEHLNDQPHSILYE
ncbi:MAG: hypothetical protein KDC28_00010 [Saprospiraceae bacterium]|nr:hypothetical protein [Saprospiraceae bacterium]MCB9321255.1 hypothetical protein [Lewinellaceae bacterium]